MKLRFRALILAIIVFIGFIAAKNIYSCELSAQLDKGIYRAAELGEIENLYIGSSMFGRGINIFEAEKFSAKSFVLAYNGFDPVNEFLVIEYLLKKGLNVKNLYLDMYAYSVSQESRLAESRMIFDSPLSLKIAIWKSITNLNTSSRENFLAVTWESFISSGNDIFSLWPLYKRLVGKLYHKGGTNNFIQGMTIDALKLTPVPETGSAKMNQAQKDSITRIIQICRENNINLVFVETPKFYYTIKSGVYSGIMREYIDLLEEHQANFFISQELLNHLEISGTGYNFSHDDPALFMDHIHLSTLGSVEFTKKIASR